MTAARGAPRLHPDARRSRLRAIMDRLARGLDGMSADGEARSAWRELTAALDLGPEPEVRDCPNCNAIAMRQATICSECWHPLTPPSA